MGIPFEREVDSNELFAALSVTQDAKEGVDAFLHKRKPEWKGR